ncbi:MAG: hypothetical protein HY288_10440 [Planctomycetia bacterium]|nr:hypothetical protein [Planctomycetia bacterium]
MRVPNDPSLHEFRGLVRFATKQYKAAASAVYAVLSAGPGWDWTTLINLYPKVEVYSEQLRALEAYHNANPNAAEARFLLAYQYLTCGETDAASAELKAVARKYRVSDSWVRNLKRQRRETGQIGPRQQRVSHATKLDDHLPRLQQLVEAQPDATLMELRTQLGVDVAPATIWRALRRLQLTFKKKLSMPPSKTDPMFKHGARSGKPR